MSETKQSNAARNVGTLLLELSMMSTPCHSCINSSITGWRKVLIHFELGINPTIIVFSILYILSSW